MSVVLLFGVVEVAGLLDRELGALYEELILQSQIV
jgi:hypothetical protein